MRLARARARLRLEFVLALRGVELTQVRCRAVLLAISAADVRRQKDLDAAEHLAHCATCAALSAPLVERRRAIASWLPIGGILAALRALPRKLRTPKGQAVAAGAAATGIAVAIAIAAMSASSTRTAPRAVPAPPPASTPAPLALPTLTAGGSPILPLPPAGLAPYNNAQVEAHGVPVLAIVPGRGVWIGVDNQQRLWIEFLDPANPDVELVDPPVPIQVGQRLDFTGTLAVVPADMAAELELSAPDTSLLTAEGYHIHVQSDTLVAH
jgi:hypothetical protein